jgi:uncharacterized repeat protein (TIGR01451 family)
VKLNVRVAGDRLALAGLWLTASLLVVLAGILLHLGQSPIAAKLTANNNSPWQAEGQTSPAAAKPASPTAFGHVPLSFEANQGQTDAQVKFLARGGGYTLFLTRDEAVLKLSSVVGHQSSAKQHSAVSTQHSATSTSIVRMKLVGANAGARVIGSEQLPSRSNYFVGNDPAKWRRDVPQFARVRYGQVYPAVDLVYYGNQGRLEYDFEVAPGADPEQIGLQIQGAQKLTVNSKGDLVAETAAGDVQLHAPEVYQNIGGQKRAVSGKFVLSADHRVRFALGEYDRGRTLVIDPVLSYATYLGGTGDEGCGFISGTPVSGCPGVAVDGAGNMYVAGATTSADFPAAGTAFQSTSTSQDAFIARFDSTGALKYSTYLGGTGAETTAGIAADSSQNIYVAGNTTSTDFPTTSSNAFQATSTGGTHVFVTELAAAGNALVYSTYLAGNGTDVATGLAIDNAAGVYVSGLTTSQNVGTGFPSTGSAFQVNPTSANQFFFTKLNTAASGASSMAYSSYLGGSTGGTGRTMGGGIAVDSSRNVYLTGGTDFTNMPVLNAFQATNAGGLDAFVAKFNVNVSGSGGRLYLSYFGGTGDDVGYGIAVDPSGNAYVTGATNSPNITIPAGANALEPCLNSPLTAARPCPTPTAPSDAFVAKVASSGSPSFPLSYFTYLGGSQSDVGLAIAADAAQAAHVAGITNSTDVAAGANASGGGQDAFAALIQTTNGTSVGRTTGDYTMYLGGGAADDGTGVAIDSNGNSYIAGETASGDFLTHTPPQLPAFQTVLGGSSDAFLSKLTVPVALAVTGASSPNPVGIGNQATFTYTIKNSTSAVATNLIFVDSLPISGATFASISSTPGACTTVVNATVTCSIGTLGIGATATVKVNLTPTATGLLTNSATVQANGAAAGGASASVNVVDFTLGISPTTAAVVAGNSATFQVQVGNPSGQTSFFPDAVSLSCSAGVPTGAGCTFSTNPLTLTSTSAISSTLTLTTTARPVTTGRLQKLRTWYAAILPITGLTFLGLGLGTARRRRWLIGIFAVLVFGLAGLQLACSGSSGGTTPPAGTPAGTYPITLTGTSGSASHAVRMTLVVQ